MKKLNTFEISAIASAGLILAWFGYTYFYYKKDYQKFKEKHCQDLNGDGKFDNPYNPFGSKNKTENKKNIQSENQASYSIEKNIKSSLFGVDLGQELNDIKNKNCRNSYSLYKFGNMNIQNTKGNYKGKLVMKLI